MNGTKGKGEKGQAARRRDRGTRSFSTDGGRSVHLQAFMEELRRNGVLGPTAGNSPVARDDRYNRHGTRRLLRDTRGSGHFRLLRSQETV